MLNWLSAQHNTLIILVHTKKDGDLDRTIRKNTAYPQTLDIGMVPDDNDLLFQVRYRNLEPANKVST